MNKNTLDILHDTAEEFGHIAKNVNESSKKRKQHSENALDMIRKTINIGDTISKYLESVSEADIEQRDQDNTVRSTCFILDLNLKKQLEIIKELQATNEVDNEIIEELQNYINNLTAAVTEATDIITGIIDKDNELILRDNIINKIKLQQKRSNTTLLNITQISLEEAEKAIQGSSSNLQRGLDMVERYNNVQSLLESKDIDEINKLIADAKKGWEIAEHVNKNSRTQLEFAERVNHFTHQLHDESIAIKEMINDKHLFFEQNIQNITVLTVILSMKFKLYLDIQKTLDSIEAKESTSKILNLLSIYIDIACDDINNLAELNYDMTDKSHLNNEVETKSVELSDKELEYYDTIKNSVSLMTEATAYPIEGSGKNIENGKILEKNLQEMANNL